MASKFVVILVIQASFCKASISPLVQQYLRVAGGSNSPSSILSNLQSIKSTGSAPSCLSSPYKSIPSAGSTSLSGLALPSLLSALLAAQSTQAVSSPTTRPSVPLLQSSAHNVFQGLPLSESFEPNSPLPSLISALLAAQSAQSYSTPISRSGVSLPQSSPQNFISSFPSSETVQPNGSTGGIDATLLNNLAIAMQLLIVNNILNSPAQDNLAAILEEGYEALDVLNPSDKPCQLPSPASNGIMEFPCQLPQSSPNSITEFGKPSLCQTQKIPGQKALSENYLTTKNYPQTQNYQEYSKNYPEYLKNYPEYSQNYPSYQQYDQPQSLPNANFIGANGLVELNSLNPSIYGSPPPNPRTSLTLMSPYEALGPSSPFQDPILSSPFGSIITSKKDFQSPYSAFNDDAFTNDLFGSYQ